MTSLFIGIVTITFVNQVSSQGCITTDRSPNNPVTANCDTGFFDLDIDPTNECICCNVGATDDNPPDECQFANPPTLSKIAFGTLTCNENFDCCSCDALICNDCAKIECIGDSSCIGVDEITANGGCNAQGTDIVCGGDVACFRTGITGECIRSLICNGDNSCGESTFIFNQNIIVPNTINGLSLPFNGDESAPGTTIYANNVVGVTCGGDNSCGNTTFVMNCKTNNNDNGCKLEVGGDNSAPHANWNITGVDIITCAGDGSCISTIFDVDCVPAGCPITINGEIAAQQCNWDINNVKSFSCLGPDACQNSNIKLNCINNGIGCQLSCGGSCEGAQFDVTNSRGIVCNGVILNPLTGVVLKGGCQKAVFKLTNNIGGNINCGAQLACKNALFTDGIGNNINNIDNIMCTSQDTCKNAVFKVNPTNNVFSVGCNGANSCQNAVYNIITSFDSILSFSCDAANACRGASVTIENVGLDLTIETIIFGSLNSGRNAMFDIESEGNISLNSIGCSGEDSCRNIEININLLSASNGLTLSVTCGALRSCVSATVTIKRVGILLSSNQVNGLNINILCNVAGACNNANVNGIPFTDF